MNFQRLQKNLRTLFMRSLPLNILRLKKIYRIIYNNFKNLQKILIALGFNLKKIIKLVTYKFIIKDNLQPRHRLEIKKIPNHLIDMLSINQLTQYINNQHLILIEVILKCTNICQQGIRLINQSLLLKQLRLRDKSTPNHFQEIILRITNL